MDRNAFHQLLKRYTEGTCSETERQMIDQWYELLDDESAQPADHTLNEEMEQRLWNNIRGKVRAGAAPVLPLHPGRREWIKWVVGAAALLVLGACFYIYRQQRVPGGEVLLRAGVTGSMQERTNNTGIKQEYTLEDGSRVVLEPGSKLAYPLHFLSDKRSVYLAGTAFFSVSKNASSPFYVYNDGIVTQVLGTSFTVKTGKEQVEVAVRTGRVAVYENGDLSPHPYGNRGTNGVIITPNEKVTYYAEDRHFVTSLVDTPVAVAGLDGNRGQIRFVFEDAPLSQVLANLEKAYNIQISVENENLDHCPFTGDISSQSLYDKLELICRSIRATYEIKGTAILIKGKGCN
jgi:transmembrane sensor